MQQYVVKPEDTLYLIAKEFNVPLAQLIKANPQITNPNLIYEGQTITIPDLPEIPDQIRSIESDAVTIIDDIMQSDWKSADSKIDGIRTALNQLVPILQNAEVANNIISGLNNAVRALEQNIVQQKTFPAISQANQITQIIADALDYFNVIVPTDLLRLIYFARQIIVNVEQNDWAEAYQNYRRALAVWQRLSPELDPKYGGDATLFDQALENMRSAIEKKDYRVAINSANRMMQLVNTLATDFQQMYT